MYVVLRRHQVENPLCSCLYSSLGRYPCPCLKDGFPTEPIMGRNGRKVRQFI